MHVCNVNIVHTHAERKPSFTRDGPGFSSSFSSSSFKIEESVAFSFLAFSDCDIVKIRK